jgi:hypothetical protein
VTILGRKKWGRGVQDPISVIRPGPVLIILAVFVAGFLWELRRASR